MISAAVPGGQPSPTIRVTVIARPTVVRAGLAQLLDQAPDIQVVELLSRARARFSDTALPSDVTVVDVGRRSDDHVLRGISALADRFDLLVVSESLHAADARALRSAGAAAHLTWSAPEDAFPSAVRDVARGEHRAAGRTTGRLEPLRPLSDREREVLGYLASGHTHAQTATRMGVSKGTVETYVARIRTKLGVANKAELALAALDHAEEFVRRAR
ncbi:response regulator transcription factor [Kibdelosporangium persicum]|uniref:HTH luxR-type domain-containing protein n=1 Tax=Kibdelosporangium persicum TaxID=2698649 RepID=A0ABX2FDS3_9PSEU|nr:response regulator transcription factor [Kibdelosporangium persicum]NRN69518.1 hypothetical protein [Kibdelosporangium persicum]